MVELELQPHDVIGQKIYDFCVKEAMISKVGSDVIITALLSATQNIANNSNSEGYALSMMGRAAHELVAMRDAKIESVHATHH